MNHSPPTPNTTHFRRRRLVYLAALVCSLLFLFSVSWELPASLKDGDFNGFSAIPTPANAATIAEDASVDEIYGLFYLLTKGLKLAHDVNPAKPIPWDVYSGGSIVDWKQFSQDINRESPIFVFSKTYCPYSKATKTLLASLALKKDPIIVEVDLRDDLDYVKAVLVRLTHHSTFPNTLLQGKSIGGNDNLQAANSDGSLEILLRSAGISGLES